MAISKRQHKHIRTGGKVVVISGDEKGSTGTVLARRGNDRVIVQGINIHKKHVKGGQNRPGSIIEREAPIHVSKLKVAENV